MYLLVRVCTHVCTYMYHDEHVVVSQHVRISSLLSNWLVLGTELRM